MENQQSVKKNYLYNVFLQGMNLLIPLVITPYISRVFHAEIIGEISYTQSVVNYLILFGNLGTGVFAMRQVAYFRGDEKKQTEFIFNIAVLKLIILVPVFIVYLFLIFSYREYSLLFLVEGTYLLAETLSIEWYFSGNENFKATVVRSSLVKAAGFVFTLLFVKDADDKYLYVLIMGGSLLVGNVILWFVALKGRKAVRPSKDLMRGYFIGSLLLFFPQIAGSVYSYCDKIMMKVLSGNFAENGYSEQAQKIIRLSITLITALPTVMLPRISAAYSRNEEDVIASYMTKSAEFVLVLGMPMTFGIIGISDNLIPWFFGMEYAKAAVLVKVLSPVVFFNSLYNVIGYQYLLSTKREKLFTITILAGACVNFGINLLLIPGFGSAGASLASVIAEVTVTVSQLFFVWKIFSLKTIGRCFVQTLAGSLFMYGGIQLASRHLQAGPLQTALLIIIGAVIYGMVLVITKNELVYQTAESVKLERRGEKKECRK